MDDATGSGERRRASTSVRALALVAALAVLAIGLVGAERSRALTIERRASQDEAVLAQVTSRFVLDLEDGLDEVDAAARAVGTSGPAAVARPGFVAGIPGATAVGFVDSGGGTSSGLGAPLTAADRRDPVFLAVLDRTRDSSAAAPATALLRDGGERLLLVAAAFLPSASGTRPLSTVQRRALLVGWVVASVDVPTLLAAGAPPGAVVAIGGAGAGLPDRLPSLRIMVRDRPFTLIAGMPDAIDYTAPTALLAAGAIGAALLAAAAIVLVSRRLEEQRRELARSRRQVELVGEVAPIVQQSLELEEVLPAVAVQLTDHFDLAGVRLSTGGSAGSQLELFSLGARPQRAPTPVLQPPDRLAEGEALTLALQRGGRNVALLELVAGRDLDESDLRSLRAISELVAAAVVNASLFASQQAAVRRLREVDMLKTVFLSTASHELRTPATAIGGFASLLVSSWDRFDDERRRDFAERIAANARSLGAVVQDLLDFSLLDRGAVALALVPVDLDAVVRGVVDRLSSLFEDHTIICTSEPAPMVAAEVNGLERVVTNLLTNAVKFSPAGSTVDVSVAPRDGGAEISVSDQGPGVPPDERARIFTRFYRGTGDAVVQTRGVGIGLSVVAELVERMSGRVSLDDAPSGGARFSVWLPASTATEPEEVVDATTR